MARFNYDQLTKIWRASSRDRSLTREDLDSVKIEQVAAALLESAPDMSLRAEGHFVYGISQIWGEKAQFLLQDSQKADENIGLAFREYLQNLLRSESSNAPAEHRIASGSDLELPSVIDLPPSLMGSSQHITQREAAANGDLSIDAIMRGDDEEMDDLAEGENVVRSAEEQAALEGLDFGLGGDDLDMGGGDGPGNLDFGSDIGYSSSPPHTPRGEENEDVEINHPSSSPNTAQIERPPVKRRRRGAPIDNVITISRPRLAAPSILRSPPAITETIDGNVDEEGQLDEDAYIPLDEATEKLIDPIYVEEEMKRRRRIESGEMGVAEQPQEEEAGDLSVDFGDFSFGDNDLDFGGDGDDGLENEEDEDTPEALESDQRKARDTVRDALRRKGDTVEFDEIASSSKARACTLMEILTLAARGRVDVRQTDAWGPVQITKV